LRRSYTPQELKDYLATRRVTLPFGPYGCLPDIHWFNYFGRVYVDAIGRKRLMAAGWDKVEEIGNGLACYATKNINDANSRERRDGIGKTIEEFIWTPGCKPDEKRIVDFDFSEQLAVASAGVAPKDRHFPSSVHFHFAGLSSKEQEAAVRLLEDSGIPAGTGSGATEDAVPEEEKGAGEKKGTG
jgi:hypothetical protein